MRRPILSGRSGGVRLFSVIGVTYPAGSVCTCTKGTKSYKAKNTSGRALFAVPETGEWTVSCTDGTQTASKTVTISAEGEAVSVELVYELLLFFDGNAYTDVTGGWVSKIEITPASCSVKGAYLEMYAGHGGYATSTTGNLIDLTNFNVLEATIAESGAVNDNRSRVAVLDPTNQNLAYKDALTQGVHIVDLSEITGDCRIRFGVSSNLTYKISKVRLY